MPYRNFDLSNIFFPSPLYINIVTGPFLVCIISGSKLCKKVCKFFSCFEVSVRIQLCSRLKIFIDGQKSQQQVVNCPVDREGLTHCKVKYHAVETI